MSNNLINNDFVTRYLEVIIGIGTGQMGDGTPGVFYTFTQHRMSATIQAWGGETQGEAAVKIYGMSPDLMNKLTTIGPIMTQLRAANSIQILAGTDPNALTTVYNGAILTAFADYNAAPDVVLNIEATSAAGSAMKPAQPTAYSGVVTVDTIMRTLANNLGFSYENVDVDTVLFNPTFNGSYLDQIKACAYAADIDYSTDNLTLAIKNRWSSYSGESPVISPATGMVGYPVFSSNGMSVKSVFLPSIRQGGTITVQGSQIVAANGKWLVNNVQHELESMMPNGKWFTTCGVFANGLS